MTKRSAKRAPAAPAAATSPADAKANATAAAEPDAKASETKPQLHTLQITRAQYEQVIRLDAAVVHASQARDAALQAVAAGHNYEPGSYLVRGCTTAKKGEYVLLLEVQVPAGKATTAKRSK